MLTIDVRFKKVKDEIGLMSWRHINPKSIRDKSYIILKRETKPLHFVEIANKITEAGFDKKWLRRRLFIMSLLEMNILYWWGAVYTA